MNIKNKIYHTAYFLLFGIIVGILRWSICIVDTNGTMDFTPFLQAFLLIVALLLFVILDIILHKIALRAISITILLCFNIWSYTYYFKSEKALPVGFSGKARYLQASMHISYKKWLSGCCRD